MKRRQFFQTSAAIVVASVSQSGLIFSQTAKELDAGSREEDPIAGPAKGPWRRLFLDGAVTEFSRGLSRIFHAATKAADNPVVQRDQPWEGVSAITGPYVYGTVMWEDRYFATWKTRKRRGRALGAAWSEDVLTGSEPMDGPVCPDERSCSVFGATCRGLKPHQGWTQRWLSPLPNPVRRLRCRWRHPRPSPAHRRSRTSATGPGRYRPVGSP